MISSTCAGVMVSHKNLIVNLTHISKYGDKMFPENITEQCMFQKVIGGLTWAPPYHDLVYVDYITCLNKLKFFKFDSKSCHM